MWSTNKKLKVSVCVCVCLIVCVLSKESTAVITGTVIIGSRPDKDEVKFLAADSLVRLNNK